MLTSFKNLWADLQLGLSWRDAWRRRKFERVRLASGNYDRQDWSKHVVIVDGGAEVSFVDCEIADLDHLDGSISFPRNATDNAGGYIGHGLPCHYAARTPS